MDLTNASHEEAVIAIRNAISPVRFVVRGLPTRKYTEDSSMMVRNSFEMLQNVKTAYV